MDLTADDLAGVVDLFGALTREELGQACSELTFKRGEDAAADAFESDVEAALASYHLLAVDEHGAATDDPLLVAGPAAFPSLPDDAGDLPHILDVPDRDLDEERLVRAAQQRFREDAVLAVQAGDDDRIASLLDVSYDLEAWGPVELDEARERLDSA